MRVCVVFVTEMQRLVVADSGHIMSCTNGFRLPY